MCTYIRLPICHCREMSKCIRTNIKMCEHVSSDVHMWVPKCVCMFVCVWFLAYVTHHIDGSQACSCLALFLGVTE